MIIQREQDKQARLQALTAQGMVLLENRRGTLPLAGAGQAALFGEGVRGISDIEGGLLRAGLVITSQRWLDACSEGDIPLVTSEDVAATDRDIAIYVITRSRSGDPALTERETRNIQLLAAVFQRLVVILQTPGMVDVSPIRRIPGVGALLFMGEAGSQGGDALADLLLGKRTPSGHLASTWAQSLSDAPDAGSRLAGAENRSDDYVTGGIFAGYRYFDTWQKTPAYPFGYGLSYTRFMTEYDRTIVSEGTVTVRAIVTNTGNLPGQQVLQVYVSAPAGRLEKPWQVLAGFEKTGVLAPGERCELRVALSLPLCASFDPEQGAFVLEKGEYVLRLGENSRSTKVVSCLVLSEDVIVRKVRPVLPKEDGMYVLSARGRGKTAAREEERERGLAPKLYLEGRDLSLLAPDYGESTTPLPRSGADHGITLEETRSGAHSAGELLSQLSEEELLALCTAKEEGNGARTTSALLTERHIPALTLAAPFDGEKADRLPAPALLARSFDRQVLTAAGDLLGEQMEETDTDLVLLPILGLARTAAESGTCLSEDPFLSGVLAAALVRGVQSHMGRGAVVGRLPAGRGGRGTAPANIHLTERTLRELCLSGFGLCVRSAHPMGILTSGGLLCGTHAAELPSLLQGVVRDEWNFEGLVLSEVGAAGDEPSRRRTKYPEAGAAASLAAGTDLLLYAGGSEQNIPEGTLTRAQLERAAGHVLTVIRKSAR
ncbi:MAG: glycoside hydrolase family 3 C-terminal domain-containing protein [Lachnospiraceae bacterium]